MLNTLIQDTHQLIKQYQHCEEQALNQLPRLYQFKSRFNLFSNTEQETLINMDNTIKQAQPISKQIYDNIHLMLTVHTNELNIDTRLYMTEQYGKHGYLQHCGNEIDHTVIVYA